MGRPRYALTKKDLAKYKALSKEEKRRTKLYWAWKGKAEGETILYTANATNNTEYHLELDWGGPLFDNYWHAYAYAITRTDHLKNA